MNLNGRLMLLLVVTGLFMRAWGGNGRMDRALANSSRRGTTQAASRAAKTARIRRVAVPPRQTPVTVHPVKATEGEHWTTWNCPVALPGGMTAGTYRVVSDRGRVATIVVPQSKASAEQRGTDFSVTTVGHERWYFIRIQPAAVLSESTAIPQAAARERIPFANRKFDFTGYISAPEAELPVAEVSERPVPPDLPSPL